MVVMQIHKDNFTASYFLKVMKVERKLWLNGVIRIFGHDNIAAAICAITSLVCKK